MNIGGLIFGGFCLFVIVAGVMYMTVINSNAAPITDSYGNTLGNVTNGSQALAISESTTPGLSVIVLLVAVILVIAALFAIGLAAKTFLT